MKIFTEQVSRGKALIYDLRAIINDEKRYFIVKILPAKHQAFLQTIDKNSGFRLEDFGQILYRGWDEPEEKIKEILRKQYGMYKKH